MTMPARNRTKSGVCVGSVPALGGHIFFCGQRAGNGDHRYHGPEPSEKHGYTNQGVIERRIGREAGKGAAVIV